MKLLLIILFSISTQNVLANTEACTDYEKFTDVSESEMSKIVKEKTATIIDVNTEKSFKDSHIPGAVHFAANEKTFDKVLPKDKNAMVIAYCGGKMCTAWQKAAKVACEMGYKNIRHFSEGIKGWDKLNSKTKKG